MTMILIGLTGLALAWIQHRHQMKALRAEVGTMPYSISGILAGLIAILGVIALIVVAMRLWFRPDILQGKPFRSSCGLIYPVADRA